MTNIFRMSAYKTRISQEVVCERNPILTFLSPIGKFIVQELGIILLFAIDTIMAMA